MSSDNVLALPATVARRAATGFWGVAFAFLIFMAFATLPSPLYGLDRTRDHLSAFTTTVVYAIFAGGTIAALLAVPSIAARIGRRGVMLAAVATMKPRAVPDRGAVIGGGAGAVFKGTTGLVLAAAAPEDRLAMTSQLLIALFIGLSIPVIGAGVALARGASAPDTVLGFAIPFGLGVAGAGWALLGRGFTRA